MPSYFRISPAIWNESWDEPTRHLAFYVLTTKHRTTEGLFRLPPVFIQVDIGWSLKKIEKHLRVLEDDEVIKRHGDVVLILKALKHQAPSNPNQVKAALRALETVPASPLDAEFFELAERFSERLAKALPEEFPKRFGQRLTKPPSPTPAPSPSPSSNFDEDELRSIFKNQPSDVVEAGIAKVRLRVADRTVTSPAAWLDTFIRTEIEKREAQERNSKPIELCPHGLTVKAFCEECEREAVPA